MKLKSELFCDERNTIVQQIFDILKINDNKNTFLLHELDDNVDKQNQILALECNVKKFFAVSSWACFYNKNVKRKAMSIIKNVLRDMNYDIIPKRVLRKDNDIIIRDSIYYIIKK
jgi:hypothetical protein